jgi:hypothetical protein
MSEASAAGFRLAPSVAGPRPTPQPPCGGASLCIQGQLPLRGDTAGWHISDLTKATHTAPSAGDPAGYVFDAQATST